jgi:hypothetical protein
VVSKPPKSALASGASAFAAAPPSSSQRATSVAPFQLTVAVTLPPAASATSFGADAGVPTHG